VASGGFDETFGGIGRAFSGRAGGNHDGPDFSTLFSPVEPYNRWPILVPFISVVGAAAVVLLSGVAVASLVVASCAVFVVVFLLSEVFGYELAMPVMPR